MVLETKSHPAEPALHDGAARKAERRSRPRVGLQWEVHVLRAGGQHPVPSLTRNVSSQGFYCLAEEPFESGERVECTVVIPIPRSGKPDDALWLKCQARVLRVEAAAGNGSFGIAFQIEEYCVVHLNPVEISPAEYLDGNGNGNGNGWNGR